MDLKLKDEITKLLIETPGISVSDIAKTTGNYYSYTHKVISEMEKENLVRINRKTQGKKEITVINLTDDYKKNWLSNFNKILRALMKNAEAKAAFLLMYIFVVYAFIKNIVENQTIIESGTKVVASSPETSDLAITTGASVADKIASVLSFELIVFVLVTLLLCVWGFRKINTKINN